MRFSVAHKGVAYLFATLGLIALSLGSTLNKIVVVVVAIGVVLSWFAEGEKIQSELYSKAWNIIAIVALAVQLVRIFSGSPLLTAGIEYAAVLQLLKLFTRRAATDYQQIILLGFLHLVAATVLSSGMEYGVIFLGFVICTPWMLALTHMRGELEENEGSARVAALASRRFTGSGFFAGTALLSIPLFFVTATFFFVFPRVGLGYFAGLKTRVQTQAGFGSDVKLGGFGTIRDDHSVSVRIRLAKDISTRPVSLPIRLRGTSFDHYERGRWSRSTFRRLTVNRNHDTYPLFPKENASRETSYTIVMDPLEEPVIFLPEGTIALQIPPRVKAGRDVFQKIDYQSGLDLRYRDAPSGPLTYTAHVDPTMEGYAETLPNRFMKKYLSVPNDYQRVAELALTVTAGVEGTRNIANKVQSFLRDEGGYLYTLDQPNTEGRDPLHVFLFEAKRGHCEYYSTAMAIMLRTLGIPARNVTGFLGADYNPYGDYYAVRNSNAHSWVEVLVNGRWTTFDPTPSDSQIAATPSGLSVRLQYMMDAMRIRWAEYIVEYSIRDQSKALSWVLSRYNDFKANRRGVAKNEKSKGAEDFKIASFDKRWVVVIPLLILFMVIVFITRRKKSHGDEGPALHGDQLKALKLYKELESELKKSGRVRGLSKTPQELAEELMAEDFAGSHVAHEITEAYLATRFGDEPLPEQRYVELRKRIAEIGASRRA